MKKYICTEPFNLPEFDEHDCIVEGNEIKIAEGSEWWILDYTYLSDIRLENDSAWMEIPKEVFTRNFKEKENENE